MAPVRDQHEVRDGDSEPSAAFASDNCAGAHPDVLAAIAEANGGYAASYGADSWTKRATGQLRRLLDCPDAEVLFVYGGTGANVLCLEIAGGGASGVVCADCAHIETDECGAPERLLGTKLVTVPTHDGKLVADDLIDTLAARRTPVHARVPSAVLSLTQATELGTTYGLDELRALGEVAHAHHMRVHIDGARLANAAVSLGVEMSTLVAAAGLDVLSLGGTKNGMLFGEAVVCLDPELAHGALFLRKQITQTPPKVRYIAAQVSALFGTDLWRSNAAHANRCALQLADKLMSLPDCVISTPVDANAVFARLPKWATEQLADRFAFHTPDPRNSSEIRLMTSWQTTADDIDSLIGALNSILRVR